MDIRVLWIDDQPNDDFLEMAEKYGLYIENRMNVDSGIEELIISSNNYDAIILDANCISHNDGSTVTEVSALMYAILRIKDCKIDLPWFVYSAGGFEGEDAIDFMVKGGGRLYDDKNWYRKPLEIKELFTKIKEVVPKSEVYKIKQKYSNIFSWYPNTADLVKIVEFYEYGIDNDPSVFNLIRKEMEWLMGHLYECGLLLEPYNGSGLSGCSKFLGENDMQCIVPIHIQRSLHSVATVCNEGSHRLSIDETVKNGKAPYLVKSSILELLNILYWVKDFSKTPEDVETLRNKVKDITTKSGNQDSEISINNYEGKVFVVEEDELGNLHCEKCKISFNLKQYIGQRVRLSNVVVSTSQKTKEIYPFHAIRVEEI